MIRQGALVVLLALCINMFPRISYSLDNDTFTELFQKYDWSVRSFVEEFTENKWGKAGVWAAKLERQSEHLESLAVQDTNKEWLFDVTNLHNHSKELMEAVKEKNAVESVYLVGILVQHIGFIQSANPLWMKEYLGHQIKILEEGVHNKDRDKARDAAEILHTSANKIMLSIGRQRKLYIHTRWMSDVRLLNRWGDQIIADVNGGDWSGPKEKLPKIRLAYKKWVKAFK